MANSNRFLSDFELPQTTRLPTIPEEDEDALLPSPVPDDEGRGRKKKLKSLIVPALLTFHQNLVRASKRRPPGRKQGFRRSQYTPL